MPTSLVQEMMIELINDYEWNPSFSFQKMVNLPIARGTLEGISNKEYQRVVFKTHGLVLFLSDAPHTYFCLPSVAKEIEKESFKKGIACSFPPWF